MKRTGRPGTSRAVWRLVGPLCILSSVAPAAPWNVEPTVSAMAVYQSNPLFDVNRSRSGSGEVVTLSLPVDWSDERTVFKLSPTANAGQSRGSTGLGEHNRGLGVLLSRDFETGSLRASGNAARVDLFGLTGADLGIYRPVGHEITHDYTVGAIWHPTERSTLDLSQNSTRVAFHVDSGTSPYVDYQYDSQQAQYSYAATPTFQAVVSASLGDFSPDRQRLGTHDRSLQVGGTWTPTEQLSATATFGRSRVKSKSSPVDTLGNVSLVSLQWTGARASLTLNEKQSRQPGAQGDLALQTDYSLTWQWHHDERLTYAALARLTKYDDAFSGVEFSSRRYETAETWLTYLIQPQWRVEFHVTAGRTEFPKTVTNRVATSASSVGGFVSITRVFGRTKLN